MADSAALVANLVTAIRSEDAARAELLRARAEQARLLRELRATGLQLPIVAHRVARGLGLVLTPAERLRLAERLRKRSRKHVPAFLPHAHGQGPLAASTSERAPTPTEKEQAMPKLVKKTVTLEYVDERDVDEDDDSDESEEEGGDDEEEPEVAPQRRRRK